MAFSFTKFFGGINLKPNSVSQVTSLGDLDVTQDGKLNFHNGVSSGALITETSTATLVNKTIDADANFISNIDDGNIKVGANISVSKLAPLTVSRAIISDSSGVLSVSSVTSTELGYVSGVTSSIQTQLDSKRPSSSPVARVDIAAGTPNEVVVNDGTGLLSSVAQLPISQGGTGSSVSTIAFNNLSPLTTKGDILVRDSSDNIRLPVGADTLVLTADSSTPSGLTWAAGGSGGGSGFNYISNGTAITNTTGWVTYADAAGPAPVNGTGGSPSVTLTRTTSNPLRGPGSFLLSKDAANRQGEGTSYDFSIASADRAQPLTISFEYQPTANFVSGTGASQLSDVVMYIYDVTNAVLIQPAPFVLSGGSLTPNKFSASFQTASNSSDYRLIFHVASTNVLAYDLKFDDVAVGPQTALYGSPISDFTSYTPTVVGTVNLGTGPTVAGKWRRVGDSMEIELLIQAGTSPANGTVAVSIPPGYSIDAAKLSNSVPELGSALYTDQIATDRNLVMAVVQNDATTVNFRLGQNVSTTVFPPSTAFTNNADRLVARFTAPILGWGSNVVMSQDASTRVVAAAASSADGAIAIGAALSNLPLATIEVDTHGTYNPGLGAYTVPVSGIYQISGAMFTAGTTGESSLSVAVQQNGVVVRQDTNVEVVGSGGGSYNPQCRFDWLLQCVAGDLLQFYGTAVSPTTLDPNTPNRTRINIVRLSGPAAIAASETVAASYSLNTTFSPASGTPVVVPFDLKNIDTHGAYDVGTSRFTAPKSGIYAVNGALTTVDNTITYTLFRASLFKNGSQFRTIQTGKLSEVNTIAISAYVSYDFLVQLNAGDYIDIRVTHNGGAGQFLINDTTSPIFGCYVDIRSL